MEWWRLKSNIKGMIARSGLRPSHRIEVLNGLLEFGEWLRHNAGAKTFDSRYECHKYINEQIVRNAAVDYLEFGVFAGDSIRYWTQLNSNPGSRFFGFDSFEGLPEDMKLFTGVLARGAFDVHGRLPHIEDGRVRFVKGYFQDSLPQFLHDFSVKSRLVVHLDADLYSSTLFVLASLHPILVTETILLFDEFAWVDHEFRAFRDYSSAFLRKYRLLAACEPFYSQVAIELL